MKHRVAVVGSHVIQYQAPLFRRLAGHPEIDLTVFYCSPRGAKRYRDRDMGVELAWDVDLLAGYRSRFLKNYSPFQFGPLRLINPALLSIFRREKFDAVLVMLGWGSVSAWLAFRGCRRGGTPFFLHGDSSFIPRESIPRRLLRRLILRRLFQRADGFLITGNLNAAYYRHFGADPGRFYSVPWAIDNERFAAASAITPQKRLAIRKDLGLDPSRVTILFSGKLIERKDPAILLAAISRMKHRDRVAAIFLGDGELRDPLQREAAAREIDQAALTGFINQQRIPEIYGAADVFVLPSRFDPRATVVNEAMASGLPVVISTMVGPKADLVRHGENGFVFETGDAEALARILDLLAGDDALRERMGRRSREIIATWGYDQDIEGILAAVESVHPE